VAACVAGDGRRTTVFGRWLAETGVGEVVDALADDPDLRVTANAVYEWLRGRAPRPERARALVRLSRGRITLDDIYDHVETMKVGRERRACCSE